MCKYSSKKHICLHIWTICKWPSNPWLPIIFAPRCKCCANVAFTVIATDSKSSAISVFALACADVSKIVQVWYFMATHLLKFGYPSKSIFSPSVICVTSSNLLSLHTIHVQWRCFFAVSAVDCDQIKTACHAYTSRNDYLAMNLKVPDCIGKDDILSLKINTVTSWEPILGVDRRLVAFGLGIDNTRQRLIMICISCFKLVSTNSTQ